MSKNTAVWLVQDILSHDQMTSVKEKKKKKNASVSKFCADMQTFGAVSSQLSVLLRKVILFWLV